MATFRATRRAEDLWTDWSFWDFYADTDDIQETDNGDGTFTAKVSLYLNDEWGDEDYNEIIFTVTFSDDDLVLDDESDDEDDAANLIGGTVDSIEYFNNNKLLMTVTDLPSYSAPYFSYLLNNNDGEDFSSVVISQDNLYIGTGSGNAQYWEDGPADRIHTGAGDDTVRANGGDDTIYDFLGKDFYNGGAGEDLLSYERSFFEPVMVYQGIVADLNAGKIVGYDDKTDTVKNIERVAGTFLDDIFIGDDNDNTFYGFAGADSFDGGGGFNRIDYKDAEDQGALNGIKVDTATGTVVDAFGYTDTFTNIQRISGTDERDVFVDDDSDMYYDGRDGNDQFNVRGGDDTLRGRDGDDRFVFLGTDFGDNVIRDWNDEGDDSLRIVKLTNANQLNIYQDGSDAVVEFSRNGDLSTITFDSTDVDELTLDVFGL